MNLNIGVVCPIQFAILAEVAEAWQRWMVARIHSSNRACLQQGHSAGGLQVLLELLRPLEISKL